MSDVEFLPLTGDAAGLRGLGHRAARASSALDDAQAAVRRVAAALDGQHGIAVTAARQRLTDVLERLAACAGGLGSAAGSFGGHADVLEQQQAAAVHAVARRDDALARIRQHEAALGVGGSFTWNAAAPGLEPAWQAATQSDLLAARADVAAAEAQWREARDAKQSSALRTASVLAGLADVRAVRAATLAGTSMADYRASWLQGQRVAALLGPAAVGGHDTDRRALRHELRELLVAHADDAVFWQSFWDTATPDEVYRALGPNLAVPAAPLADELRDALGDGVIAWARTATPAEQKAFGTAVVDGVGHWEPVIHGRSEIAAALLPSTLPADVLGGAFDALATHWDESTYLFDGDATMPLAVAVATGLARHPRLAFDRLAPNDPARLARASSAWFGKAPRYGWSDRGRSVARAFRAAVGVGSSSSDRRDQERAALLVSHATSDMRDGLLSAPVSGSASVAIARAYDPYVPAFAEADVDDSHGTTDDVVLAENGPVVPRVAVQPELDAFALRDVIAATSRNERGNTAWLAGVEEHRDDVIELMTTEDPETAGARDGLGYQFLRDAGAVAGSQNVDVIERARQRMENRGHLIDMAGYLTFGAKPAVSAGASALTSVAPHWMPDHVEIAREAVFRREPEMRDDMAGPLHEAVVEHAVAAAQDSPGTGCNVQGAASDAREQAEADAASLAPDSTVVSDTFGSTYEEFSDVQPRLEDRQYDDR